MDNTLKRHQEALILTLGIVATLVYNLKMITGISRVIYSYHILQHISMYTSNNVYPLNEIFLLLSCVEFPCTVLYFKKRLIAERFPHAYSAVHSAENFCRCRSHN